MLNSLLLSVVLAPTSDAATIDHLFDALDRNHDGFVAASELSEKQKPWFQRALRVSDINEDGVLNRKELAAVLQEPVRQQVGTNQRRNFDFAAFDFAPFDTNKDGRLSKTELPAPLQQRLSPLFERLGTAAIPLDTIRRLRQQQSGTPSPNASTPTKQNRMSAAMDKRSQDARSSFFDRLDADGNGQLSVSELPQRLRSRMQQIDRNNDGRVSREEFETVMQR